MEKVRVLTGDERLRREILLLLPKDYLPCATDTDTSLLIVDLDTVGDFLPKNGEHVLCLTRSAHKEGVGQTLVRPFSFADFEKAIRRATEAEPALFLSATEERLFTVLKNADGAPVARERLIREVWGEDGNDGLLNLYIHYLRQKLEKDGKRRIYAARGKGYFYQC